MARLVATLSLLLTAALVAGCASAPAAPAGDLPAADRLSVAPCLDRLSRSLIPNSLPENPLSATPGHDPKPSERSPFPCRTAGYNGIIVNTNLSYKRPDA